MPVVWQAYLVDEAGDKVSEGMDIEVDWKMEKANSWHVTNLTPISFPPINRTVGRIMFEMEGEEMAWILVQRPTNKGDVVSIGPGPLFNIH